MDINDQCEQPTKEETEKEKELINCMHQRLQDSFRVKIDCVPRFFGVAQLRKIIQSRLSGVPFRKVKMLSGGIGYVSFTRLEDVDRAIAELHGRVLRRGRPALAVSRTGQDSWMKINPDRQERISGDKDTEAVSLTTVPSSSTAGSNHVKVDIRKAHEDGLCGGVTPLAHLPYGEQLALKQRDSDCVFAQLLKQLKHTGAPTAPEIRHREKQGGNVRVHLPILGAPTITGCRNKAELTIGFATMASTESEQEIKHRRLAVGFVTGKQAGCYSQTVVPLRVGSFTHLTNNTLLIADEFESFINEFDLVPFDERSRSGFWRTLLVRDFRAGDCLLVVAGSLSDELEAQAPWLHELKRRLVERFMPPHIAAERQHPYFRVTSIYMLLHTDPTNSSVRRYDLVAGVPFVYEQLLGLRFRVSPGTFFQTSTTGAEMLYTTIVKYLLLNAVKSGPTEEAIMIANAVENGKALTTVNELLILDICCGAGTIGQCLIAALNKSNRLEGSPIVGVRCLGVELLADACEDARENARENGLSSLCTYVHGPAERLFSSELGTSLAAKNGRQQNVVGVLDPPRAGLPDKVVIACRRLVPLRTLIYVACDPGGGVNASKNIIDLCRPTSNKFEGRPFGVHAIQPLDLFPQTRHMEWIVVLQR